MPAIALCAAALEMAHHLREFRGKTATCSIGKAARTLAYQMLKQAALL
jgi:hypothetical protein